MPRYFFHVSDGHDFPDTEGTELPDLATAQVEAIEASGEMLRDLRDATNLLSGEDWVMTVANEAGKRLLALRFSATPYASSLLTLGAVAP